MALQDILKKILDEAQNEVLQIEKTTEGKINELNQESEILEKKDLQKIEEKIQLALTSVENKMNSMARRESSKMKLEMKHEIISKLMDKFLEKLENADEKTYAQILEKLFTKNKETSGKIYAPPRRIEITTKHAPQGFDVMAHKDIVGGFIMETGGVKIDNTFRTLLFEEFTEPFTLYFAEELKLSA